MDILCSFDCASCQRVNLVEGMLFELCDEVLADGEEEKAVAEGERVGGTSCHSNPHLSRRSSSTRFHRGGWEKNGKKIQVTI